MAPTRLRRAARWLRAAHDAVFVASRHGRAAEVVGWSNALAALGAGAGAYALGVALWPSLGLGIGAFVLLRLALAHRWTILVAALAGTLAVSLAGGALAWMFAHVLESQPWAPQVAGVVGALVGALAPAWAYATLARHRARRVPDSLLSPASSVSMSSR